jgi:hypothetical protein
MIARLRAAALWIAVFCTVYWFWPERALRHPPGMLVGGDPIQRAIPVRGLGELHGCSVTAVASYSMEARVLHKKRYWVDGSDLVPYDVALGWGPMSDQAVIDQLRVSQCNRFFFYEWRGAPPIPPDVISAHSSNNHIIAATSEVAAIVRKLRVGQIVTLHGYLVNVTRADGFHWNTSLSRTDTGNGACELFYVEEASVENDTI